MLIEHLIDLGEADSESLAIADLGEFYRGARAKFDGDASFADRARGRVVQLQAGDAATLRLWKRLVDESKRYFAEVYRQLGVTLRDEHVRGESFYNARLPDVVSDLATQGLLTESQGARCVFAEGFRGKDGEPLPLIVQKQDGGFGYAATDLAALRYRTNELRAQHVLYVVGAPQQQHLAMVFAVARAAGWLAAPASAEHVAFGSILGPDKKMFKSRSGDTVKLIALLEEAVERAAKVVADKNPELDEATRLDVARKVGIGALKYADLSSDRIKDYVFDWDRMLAFEGNTAPYLQYAHARIHSIFRRAELDPRTLTGTTIALDHPAERALGIELVAFANAVRAVADSRFPHRLCTYLFALATRFTSFYEQCPVLRAEDSTLQRSRLALCALTAATLERGLGLLGIEAPEQM
jgi:arginyl-tRNA synthetase